MSAPTQIERLVTPTGTTFHVDPDCTRLQAAHRNALRMRLLTPIDRSTLYFDAAGHEFAPCKRCIVTD